MAGVKASGATAVRIRPKGAAGPRCCSASDMYPFLPVPRPLSPFSLAHFYTPPCFWWFSQQTRAALPSVPGPAESVSLEKVFCLRYEESNSGMLRAFERSQKALEGKDVSFSKEAQHRAQFPVHGQHLIIIVQWVSESIVLSVEIPTNYISLFWPVSWTLRG